MSINQDIQDFEPDYSEWWAKENLTAEDMEWLFREIKPDDAKKYEPYLSKLETTHHYDKNGKSFTVTTGKENPEDKWTKAFSNYVKNLKVMLYAFARDDISMLMKEYPKFQDMNKQEYAQYCYDRNLRSHTKFMRFLIEKQYIHTNKALENISKSLSFDENIYKKKELTEYDALCVFLGINPKDFKRYDKLYYSIYDDGTDLKYSGTDDFSNFSNDDLWFWNKFLNMVSKIGSTRIFDIFMALNPSKKEIIEPKKYLKKLYNKGFIFKQEIYNKIGLPDITFQKTSEVYKFYKYWCRRSAWSFEQAMQVIKGKTPNDDFVNASKDNCHLNIININNFGILFECSGYYYAQDANGYIINLSREIQLASTIGEVTTGEITYEGQPIKVYKPIELLKWFLRITDYVPPLPLIEIIFEDDKKLLETYKKNLENRNKHQEEAQNNTPVYEPMTKLERTTKACAYLYRIIDKNNITGSIESKIKKALKELDKNGDEKKYCNILSIDTEKHCIDFGDGKPFQLHNIQRQIKLFLDDIRKANFDEHDDIKSIIETKTNSSTN